MPIDLETRQHMASEKVEIKILKHFEFQSKLQRMSVICIDQHLKNFRVYMKGSPQMIFKFCKTSSLPKDYIDVIQKYQIKGYRIISFATKVLD